MVFTTQIFVFYFLPLFLLLYYNLPYRWRNVWITLASYVFYGWWQPWFVGLMLFFAAVFRLVGRITVGAAGLYALALLSPPVLLGLERTNTDLLVFALLVLAAPLCARAFPSRCAGYGLIVVAAMLKLFPIAALVPLVHPSRIDRFLLPARVDDHFHGIGRAARHHRAAAVAAVTRGPLRPRVNAPRRSVFRVGENNRGGASGNLERRCCRKSDIDVR